MNLLTNLHFYNFLLKNVLSNLFRLFRGGNHTDDAEVSKSCKNSCIKYDILDVTELKTVMIPHISLL